MLITLIYQSQMNKQWALSNLSGLVCQASAKNTQINVTGILLFNGSQFLQVLEGSEGGVGSLFGRIGDDSRHYDVVELMRDYSAHRRFGKIGMTLIDLRQETEENVVEHVQRIGLFRKVPSPDDRVFKFISAFIGRGCRYPLKKEYVPSRWANDCRTASYNFLSANLLPDQPCRFALQPIVEPISGRIFAVEALVRSPSGGPAGDFLASIPPAEIHLFDLKSKSYAFWLASQMDLGDTQLAINLFPGSLSTIPGAIHMLLDQVTRFGLKPQQVIIEVTETEIISNFDEFQEVIKEIRVAGFDLAIDDFGAGYSGLSLLTKFQPDQIKIDRELVCDIHLNGTKQAIVVSLVQCCADLGISVVAEGVEKIEEWCWMQSAGIRLFQGFLFSRPVLNGVGEINWPQLIPCAEALDCDGPAQVARAVAGNVDA